MNSPISPSVAGALPEWPITAPNRYLIDSQGDYCGDPDGPHMDSQEALQLIAALRARMELATHQLQYWQSELLRECGGDEDEMRELAEVIAACREPK